MSDNIGKIEFGPVDPEAIRQKRKKAEPEIVTMMDLVQQKRALEVKVVELQAGALSLHMIDAEHIAEQAKEIERLTKERMDNEIVRSAAATKIAHIEQMYRGEQGFRIEALKEIERLRKDIGIAIHCLNQSDSSIAREAAKQLKNAIGDSK